MEVPLPDIPPEPRTPAVASLLDLVRHVLDRAHELEEVNQFALPDPANDLFFIQVGQGRSQGPS